MRDSNYGVVPVSEFLGGMTTRECKTVFTLLWLLRYHLASLLQFVTVITVVILASKLQRWTLAFFDSY